MNVEIINLLASVKFIRITILKFKGGSWRYKFEIRSLKFENYIIGICLNLREDIDIISCNHSNSILEISKIYFKKIGQFQR